MECRTTRQVAEHNPLEGAYRARPCEYCGETFRPRHGGQTYCTRRCVEANHRTRGRFEPVLATCENCSGAFLRTNPKRRFCSRRCRSAAHHRSYRARVPVDPSANRKRARQWYWTNRDRALARVRRWAREHRDHKRAQDSRRRAREQASAGSWAHAEWRALVDAYGGRCAYCGAAAPLTADHRIPLVRGGSNAIENIVPACKSCNSRKGTRTDLGFLMDFSGSTPESTTSATMVARGAARRTTGGRA